MTEVEKVRQAIRPLIDSSRHTPMLDEYLDEIAQAAIAALDAARSESADEPSGVGRYCNPGDMPNRKWLLRFHDQDCRTGFWDADDLGEAEAERQAREAWDRYAVAFNCHLFVSAERVPTETADERQAAIVAALSPVQKASLTTRAVIADNDN